MPIPDGTLDTTAMGRVLQALHATHKAEYGHAFPANPVEIANLRVTGRGAMPCLQPTQTPPGGTLAAALLRHNGAVFRMGPTLQPHKTAIYTRTALPVGHLLAGPATVLQKDTTTVIPPDWAAKAHQSGSLSLTQGAS